MKPEPVRLAAHGSKDMLELLQDARARVILGECDAIMVLVCPSDPAESAKGDTAWREDAPWVRERMSAALDVVQRRLLDDEDLS